METSNVIPVLTTSPSLAPSSTPSPSGEKVDAESLLWLFDKIWETLIELAKKLRNIMRAYNEVKQKLSWELQVNAFNTQMKTIDQTYKASILNGGWLNLFGNADVRIRGYRRGGRRYVRSRRRARRCGWL
ncbi:pathogenicity island 2 effector protein SseD [Salmonella enterica subsp. arizonae]|uniref:Pathogenicity island 2 effector protein SseD n=1 Tax=Salmonella enterica subsp. arizonae TaxID=59203 RepID=A0A379TBR3_SALER|nr:pathogenicity island 2 effector protein SseD [Salmonella enterica subsp. arizonae]